MRTGVNKSLELNISSLLDNKLLKRRLKLSQNIRRHHLANLYSTSYYSRDFNKAMLSDLRRYLMACWILNYLLDSNVDDDSHALPRIT